MVLVWIECWLGRGAAGFVGWHYSWVCAAPEGEGLEATGGFEPPNRGFADLRLSPLGYVAPRCRLGAEGGI